MVKSQEKLLHGPGESLGFVVIWGDGTCREIDRFDPENDIDALPESAVEWWETATAPWCVTVEITSKAQQADIVQTCEDAPGVAGYVVQSPL